MTGLNYPTNAIIRACGFVCNGNWFVETNLVPMVPLKFVNASGSPWMSNGWFNAQLTGTTDNRTVVECSPDLITWQPWPTNILPVNGWNLAIPPGTNDRPFLRARLAP